MCPALHALELSFFKCWGEYSGVFDALTSQVRSLSFCNDGRLRSIHALEKAFSFPQMKRLCIAFDHDFRGDDGDDEWIKRYPALDAITGKSSVKELTFKSWSDLVILESALLKIPRALTKSECEFHYSGHTTPGRIIGKLSPLYSTLVYLEIGYSCYHFESPAISEEVADFSSFVCLKTLIVDDYVILEEGIEHEPDDEYALYKWLPSTLESCSGKIQFYEIDWTFDYIWLDTKPSYSHSHELLLGLAEHKSTNLPCLERVTLLEACDSNVDWDYPKDLVLSAFETAGIQLVIQVANLRVS